MVESGKHWKREKKSSNRPQNKGRVMSQTKEPQIQNMSWCIVTNVSFLPAPKESSAHMGICLHACVTHKGGWVLKMKKDQGTPGVTHDLTSCKKNWQWSHPSSLTHACFFAYLFTCSLALQYWTWNSCMQCKASALLPSSTPRPVYRQHHYVRILTVNVPGRLLRPA